MRRAALLMTARGPVFGRSGQVFGWGIIGSGYAARKFVLGLRQSVDGVPKLVYSRNRERAQAFAKDFHIADVTGAFESAAQSKEVDAFFIATPPTAHRSHAVACLSQGKAVLIEKPFAATAADAQAIADAASDNGVFCMEGMWTRFLPLAARLRAMVGEGAIGTPRSLYGAFGASNIPHETDNQFAPELGGGALLHRGVYLLAFAFDLLGPGELAASVATLGPTGVDEDCAMVLRHDGGCLTTLRASLRAQLANDLTIEGTHGLVQVEAPVYRPFRLQLTRTKPSLRLRRGNRLIEALREGAPAQILQQRFRGLGGLAGRGSTTTVIARYTGNGYHYEADEVAVCVRGGARESDLMPLEQSVRMVALMEQARASWLTAAKRT